MPINQEHLTDCKLCKAHSWELVATLISGIWDKRHDELNREELRFPIGQCTKCHHVQVAIPYTQSIFDSLYFSNQAEPDMWCETPNGQKSPYEEMLEFIAPYIQDGAHIVDFGAGAGTTLKHIENTHKERQLTLASVDFHNHIQSETIEYLSADLNKLEALQAEFVTQPISLAISTHVLEHLIDPIHFLTQIRSMLSDDGHIFIEVPDCSPDAFIEHLAFTNLVHGQHIHYYSKDSLAQIARLAGLKIDALQQLTTGDIPRLLILLSKTTQESSTTVLPVTSGADVAVVKRFNDYHAFQDSLFKQIQQALMLNDTIGIWGIGGDFYQLTQSYPELIDLIQANSIILYDYELAGHTYVGSSIRCSSAIASTRYPVFMLPLYAPTREKMHQVSQSWSAQVIDPF
ncbi:class I SAM-dependent methyltransferase [Shewanella spartinae]|uniref:class I SAM-dependent methyltransferase n=1 Tax=Shewanella spartinae TaxID=2864205 RepID=UPI001C6560AC|nr:class I SAM-dependent methyltransferase [Shewanella spartinae]QYJ95051.1 class I SAM-dependent methyltransferase [Shewanella spartinae]